MPNFCFVLVRLSKGKMFVMGMSELTAEALGVLMCLMLVFLTFLIVFADLQNL